MPIAEETILRTIQENFKDTAFSFGQLHTKLADINARTLRRHLRDLEKGGVLRWNGERAKASRFSLSTVSLKSLENKPTREVNKMEEEVKSSGLARFQNRSNTVINFVVDSIFYKLRPGEIRALPICPQTKRLVEQGHLRPLKEQPVSWEDGLCRSCTYVVNIGGGHSDPSQSPYLEEQWGSWCSAYRTKLNDAVLECEKYRSKNLKSSGVFFDMSEGQLRAELQKKAEHQRALQKRSTAAS